MLTVTEHVVLASQSSQHCSSLPPCLVLLFRLADITACSPGFPDGDATKFKYCTNLQQDDYDRAHGSHTAGTVAAVRNGKGVVGVSAQRAQMYK